MVEVEKGGQEEDMAEEEDRKEEEVEEEYGKADQWFMGPRPESPRELCGRHR